MRTKYVFKFGLPILVLLSLFCVKINNGEDTILKAFAVLFGCLALHLFIWILSAIVVVGIMKNKANDECFWFKELGCEKGFYRLIKIRKWKHCLPTYDAKFYDFKTISHNVLLGIISQTEIVHEMVAILSLFTIVGTRWFGHEYIFETIAIINFIINMIYVCLQRFNRIRLRRIIFP